MLKGVKARTIATEDQFPKFLSFSLRVSARSSAPHWPWSTENWIVFADFSVPEDQHTLGELCNVVFVGNQDNSQTLLV